MRGGVTPLIVVLVGLISFGGTVATGEDPPEHCVERIDVADPAGDVVGDTPLLGPPYDTAVLDILNVAMWRTDEGVGMSLTLAADPRDDPDWYSYYWMGMGIDHETDPHRPPTWTIQRSSTYDTIESMYYENRSTYPVTWEETTFSFLIPWHAFEEAYGDAWPFLIGSPVASSAGPYEKDPVLPPPPLLESTSNDWAGSRDPFVPLPDCGDEDERGPQESAEAPMFASLAIVAALTLLVAVSRRPL